MGNCNDGACVIDKTKQEMDTSQKRGYIRAAISFVMLIAGIIFSAVGLSFFADKWVQLAWYIIAYIPVGLPVIKEAWEAIRQKDVFSEFTLMSIATIGAFFIGEYPEGVAVMLFYAVGELFQDAAVNRAKRSISALLDVRPETATVIKMDKTEIMSPENVNVGDIVEVKVGERVPLDGILLNESASFNTSALTGESVPRTIRKNEDVFAGMILTDNVSRIEVTKPFGMSALARILDLVQNATEKKAPAEQFIRKFARIYTPIVVALAALIVLLPLAYSAINPAFNFVLYDWVYRGLVFLVISCPCALVISIPLGYFGGIGAASRKGILFKGSNYLEAITKVNTVVMDKTGTLTQGVFKVQKIVPADFLLETDLVNLVASVETQSTHPIAKAIVEYAKEQNIEVIKPEIVNEIAGHGLQASINGKIVLVGNPKLLIKNNVEFPPEIATIPETIVVCAINGIYSGYILVADAPKEDAATAVNALRELGIKNIVMLSGDKQAIVSQLATELNVTQAHGDLLPEGKVEYVEQLKSDPGNNIAFVGDGINDAPVLAMSDVGIAMGGLGSDVAIETADVIIQTDQPSRIATAITIGKATRRIVIQNISLAFGVKLIVLILGAGGVATLWEAVFADVGVSLLAILNAIRILKMKF
ncbi:cadmium-translocating P-type ATPase [Parabacteroides sp. 52]|jgi:Cd2+/Zn2+-exporting ATPase|uniref:Cadmium, zinc and cobalt-transporting ATPase n=3 Tax=root TaxID=1 RepID=A0A644W3A5_9ZZZZ|nr:Cd2+/Zn2+-exporting ATPase [Parabacteroides sp. PH5-39]MDH6314159.1 Cd2+/Zn2+-exporting ATPase [Parabacteroides sp. PFB2-10]MDH6316557.1 Cd2+/Zn2+-exporting ATPase [Parabacteroides sp. PF5-13]MDH6320067.1 Cd2+/Zn2+-exporting ATPase [Parabacteroides sp. PH5-13]MDH6323700.1 Cd2+/Zn2+-exporting ATPase [Parabacteroides sp. PH5-8]MDH6327744.1 Cd2+/Zn2+-exporting ATPase [Parabacteroides sp. PH5-41]MDH6335545.1 Cd2+/Zn2+-exporting ATPase [Parabacteroides sp. PF5-5]MDH6346511.1 Cd2+/Zn2+-exportin